MHLVKLIKNLVHIPGLMKETIAFKKISKMGLKNGGNELVDFLSNTTNYFPRSSFLRNLTSVLFIPEELLQMKFF